MVATNRHEQRREQTRLQLLDAAERVFSRLGYHGASILDITEEADVSKRTFYLHFKDREDLIEQVALRSFEEVRIQIEAFKTQNADNESRELHKHMVRSIFAYANNNPDLLQMIVSEDGSHRLNMMTREYMARAMMTGFSNPIVCTFKDDPVVPVPVIANAIGGMIFQLMCWWMEHREEYTPDDMAEMTASIIYDGITVNFVDDELVMIQKLDEE